MSDETMSAFKNMMKGKHSGELSKIEYAIWMCGTGTTATKAVQESAAQELEQLRAECDAAIEMDKALYEWMQEGTGTKWNKYTRRWRTWKDAVDKRKGENKCNCLRNGEFVYSQGCPEHG